MKQFLAVVLLVLLFAAEAQAQTTQDTIYFWKTGTLLLKQSIKTADLDSITFKRPVVIVTPISTVTIGTQVWTNINLDVSTYSDGTKQLVRRAGTSKNLDVTDYSDGTPIPEVQDPTAWANLRTGAWCYYNNNAANGAIYGKLYNWYAVAGIHDTDPSTPNKTLAPRGYHISTDAEWTTLTTFLGGESVAGGKMKATTLWNSPNTDATNSSGFAGLPGGYRGSLGTFYNLGYDTGYWSTTVRDIDPTVAWTRLLTYDRGNANRSLSYKEFGLSVRCIAGEVVVAVAPTVTTTTVTGIATTSATTGGNVTNDGGAAVMARGVVYSTTANPTIDLTTKTVDGAGAGTFESSITGLTANTTYYVRAYATNSVGTSYGAEFSFTTLPPVTPIATVTIGLQTWTSQNLDVSTYRDGTPIPQVTDQTQWDALQTGAWCYYANETANGTIYGKLYNWYAVAGIHDTDPMTPNKTLAPAGYHIPTDAEWTTLYNSLGGISVAGGRMKTTGTTLWQSPNTDASNSSGFSGLPGGQRTDIILSYISLGETANWWSASETSPVGKAWAYGLNYRFGMAFRGDYYPSLGFSVRCLRD